MNVLVDEGFWSRAKALKTTSPVTVSRSIAASDSWTGSDSALQTLAQ